VINYITRGNNSQQQWYILKILIYLRMGVMAMAHITLRIIYKL
jgi:hypothetical protein